MTRLSTTSPFTIASKRRKKPSNPFWFSTLNHSKKTHDIEVLVDVASDIQPDFHQLDEAADALTPYATRFRYPNATFAVEPLPEECHEALKFAELIYHFVLDQLPEEIVPEK